MRAWAICAPDCFLFVDVVLLHTSLVGPQARDKQGTLVCLLGPVASCGGVQGWGEVRFLARADGSNLAQSF
jgi:hypothetical protein